MATSEINEATSQKLKALAEQLVASLAERMTGIEDDYTSFASPIWTKQAMDDFYASTHSLAGTAGSFGYMQISRAARDILNAIEPVMESDHQADDDARQSLDNMMVKLRAEIAEPKAEEGWL